MAVSPRRPLRVIVRGVVTVTGPRGAFTRRGTVVLRRSRARVIGGIGVRAAGVGMDVSFRGTRLRKPLSLTYHVGRQPRGHVPHAMRVTATGDWNLLRAKRVGPSRVRVRTTSFSRIVPAWLNARQWASNLEQWAGNAGDWVASGAGGRTTPLTSCGAAAPDWFTYEKLSDLVHVCSIDNAGRAEIQIKSNRGLSQLVRIPGDPAYVYIEDLPDWLRRGLWWDTNKEVILGPGQRMTVGYDRPTGDVAGQFVLNPYAARAQIDNIVRSVLDLVAGLDAIPGTALVAYAWTQCATELELSISEAPMDPEVTLGKATCMITSLRRLAEDPERALQIIIGLGGNEGDADDLFRKADRLKKAAKAFALFEQVKEHAVQSIDESMRSLFNDGNDTVRIHMTAPVLSGTACEQVGFEANTDNVAADITAYGVDCVSARQLVRDVHQQPPSRIIGPSSFEHSGYTCDHQSAPPGYVGLGYTAYDCSATGRRVTWRKY